VAYRRRAAPLGDTRVSGELVVVTSTYGRDELGTRPMVLPACERTEREPEAVGWRPLSVYGLCLGPRICGRCHASSDVTIRVAERCWLGRPGAQSALEGLFGSEAPQLDDVGRGQMPNGAQQFTLLPVEKDASTTTVSPRASSRSAWSARRW
jgi:hypothetical protein